MNPKTGPLTHITTQSLQHLPQRMHKVLLAPLPAGRERGAFHAIRLAMPMFFYAPAPTNQARITLSVTSHCGDGDLRRP